MKVMEMGRKISPPSRRLGWTGRERMLKLYAMTDDDYWRKVIIVHWLIGELPNEGVFRKWIDSARWPYAFKAMRALRKQWELNGYTHARKIRLTREVSDMDYPFTTDVEITPSQREWLSRQLLNPVPGIDIPVKE